MNDVLWKVFESLVSLLECCIVIHFICSFLKLDFNSKRGRIIYTIGVIMDFIGVGTVNHFISYESVMGSVYVLLYFIYAAVFLNGSVLKKFFAASMSVIVVLFAGVIVSGIVSSFFGNDISGIYEKQVFERIVSMILVQILNVVIFDLILKYSVTTLKKNEWRLVFSITAISFVAVALVHLALLNIEAKQSYVIMLKIAEIGIILLNVVCFYMTYTLSRSNSETEKLRLLKQQEEYRTRYAENIKTQYAEMRRLRHDMKQNLAVIAALLGESKYDEAFDYAGKLSGRLEKLDMFIDVGNDFINAILNSKLSIAKEKGIEVICSSVNNIAGIEDIDLCTLLGNMLDNAVEAAGDCRNGFIEVSVRSDENKILVVIANSISESVLDNNSELESTKNDSKNHGYGVKTIRSVAEKYNGMASFYEEKSVFYCQVILYK